MLLHSYSLQRRPTLHSLAYSTSWVRVLQWRHWGWVRHHLTEQGDWPPGTACLSPMRCGASGEEVGLLGGPWPPGSLPEPPVLLAQTPPLPGLLGLPQSFLHDCFLELGSQSGAQDSLSRSPGPGSPPETGCWSVPHPSWLAQLEP